MKYFLSFIICGLLLAAGPGAVAADAAGEALGDQGLNEESRSLIVTSPSTPVEQASGAPSFLRRATDSPADPKLSRLVFWGGFSLAQGLLAYQKTLDIWGKPDGKFHLKNDLTGDHLALSDEISHLFIAYKLAQITRQGYRWGGLSPEAAARAGAIQAAVYMAFVEFPMDAYNPEQGLGISDLLADFAGVGLAWYRAGIDNPRWDLKASVKSQFFAGNSRLLAHNNKQYDDFIYWLTYRVSNDRYNPIVLGIGYSTHHPPGAPPAYFPVDKQLYFRIGTSFAEIGRLFGRRTERLLNPAGFYFFNLGPKTGWR